MTLGLKEAGALARITYYAQTLSLLSTLPGSSLQMQQVKDALDEACEEFFDSPAESHARSH